MDLPSEIQLIILSYMRYRYLSACRQTCFLWNNLINKHIRKLNMLMTIDIPIFATFCNCHLCDNPMEHYFLYDKFFLKGIIPNEMAYINDIVIDFINHAKSVEFYNINMFTNSISKLKKIHHITFSCDPLDKAKKPYRICISALDCAKTLDINGPIEIYGIIPNNIERLRIVNKTSYAISFELSFWSLAAAHHL